MEVKNETNEGTNLIGGAMGGSGMSAESAIRVISSSGEGDDEVDGEEEEDEEGTRAGRREERIANESEKTKVVRTAGMTVISAVM